jgi:hypothetical protein
MTPRAQQIVFIILIVVGVLLLLDAAEKTTWYQNAHLPVLYTSASKTLPEPILSKHTATSTPRVSIRETLLSDNSKLIIAGALFTTDCKTLAVKVVPSGSHTQLMLNTTASGQTCSNAAASLQTFSISLPATSGRFITIDTVTLDGSPIPFTLGTSTPSTLNTSAPPSQE